MLLSIILPVFRVKDYIEDCLTSLNQITLEHEIILVHDSSQDNSLVGKEVFLDSIENLTIVDRPNKGLGMARNEGMECAKGDYIYFMDSDDIIEAGAFQESLLGGIEVGADIIYGDFRSFDENGALPIQFMAQEPISKIMPKEYIAKFYCRLAVAVVWRGIYSKELFNKDSLLFNDLKYYEDEDWTPRAICSANFIYYSHKPFYRHRERSGSLFHESLNERKCKDLIQVSSNLYEFSHRHPECETISLKLLLSGIGHIQQLRELSSIEKKEYIRTIRKYHWGNGKFDVFLVVSHISANLMFKLLKYILKRRLKMKALVR